MIPLQRFSLVTAPARSLSLFQTGAARWSAFPISGFSANLDPYFIQLLSYLLHKFKWVGLNRVSLGRLVLGHPLLPSSDKIEKVLFSKTNFDLVLVNGSYPYFCKAQLP